MEATAERPWIYCARVRRGQKQLPTLTPVPRIRVEVLGSRFDDRRLWPSNVFDDLDCYIAGYSHVNGCDLDLQASPGLSMRGAGTRLVLMGEGRDSGERRGLGEASMPSSRSWLHASHWCGLDSEPGVKVGLRKPLDFSKGRCTLLRQSQRLAALCGQGPFPVLSSHIPAPIDQYYYYFLFGRLSNIRKGERCLGRPHTVLTSHSLRAHTESCGHCRAVTESAVGTCYYLVE